jgi:diguanylate cyclase (GGDEF)-like protein/PAS domain S-box-containing protein
MLAHVQERQMGIPGETFFRNLLDNLHDGVYFVDQERRITYWNSAAERISGFSAGEVLGTHCWDNILLHVDGEGCRLCMDKCPLAATIEDGSPHESDIFLRHKAGHRVPVSVWVSPIRDGKGRIIGALESFSESSSKLGVLDTLTELQELALLDPVTGVGNRRYADVRLTAALDAFQRYNWPFGVLFMDVDHFKAINDNHGHDTGDTVLRMVARTLGGNLRSVDEIGRWGGEEFVAVITNTTEEHLLMTAERCRKLVAVSALDVGSSQIRVTVSIGATMVRAHDTPHSLLKRADALMYLAKAGGRNRVEFGE